MLSSRERETDADRLTEKERETEREKKKQREKEREPLSIVYGQLAALMAISQSDHVVVSLIPPAFLFLLLFVTVPLLIPFFIPASSLLFIGNKR